jgi:putative endonuclease
MREYHVYILASTKHGTLYVGVTGNILQRLVEHRSKAVASFTRRYAVHRLVHLECFADPLSTIAREKRLKKWPRAWKVALIEETNPEWRDLALDLCG